MKAWSRKFEEDFFTAVREGVGLGLMRGEMWNEKEFVRVAVMEKTQKLKEEYTYAK